MTIKEYCQKGITMCHVSMFISFMMRQLTYGIVVSTNDCIANSGGEKEGNISSCNTCDDKTPDIFSLCFSCGQKRNLGYLCFEIGYSYYELIQICNYKE